MFVAHAPSFRTTVDYDRKKKCRPAALRYTAAKSLAKGVSESYTILHVVERIISIFELFFQKRVGFLKLQTIFIHATFHSLTQDRSARLYYHSAHADAFVLSMWHVEDNWIF